MALGKIIKYGVFDSAAVFPSVKKTEERKVEYFEFEYIISSDATSVINDARYALKPNTFLLRKPGQRCSSYLHFKCCFFHFRFDEPCAYTDLLKKAPNYFQLIDSERYKNIFQDLVLFLQTGGDENCDFVTAKLMELFFYIGRDCVKNSNYIRLYPKGDDRFISGSLQYMQEHFGEKITLGKLASLAGYAPTYFHRVFCEIMGVTPLKYLLNIRLNNAKKLLASTNKRLSDIAYECGFSSQSHLDRHFKKAVLITPDEYRKISYSKYLSPDTGEKAISFDAPQKTSAEH